MEKVKDRNNQALYENNIKDMFNQRKEDSIYPIMDSQRLDEYMRFINDYAIKIGLGVTLIFLSSIPVLLHFINGFNLGLGIILTILVFSMAIMLFIQEGLKYTSYSDLHRSNYHIHDYDYQHILQEASKFKVPFGIGIAVGVLLILTSSIYPIHAVMISETFSLSFLIPTIVQFSVALFVLISFGIIQSNFLWFLRSDKQKAFDRKIETFKETIEDASYIIGRF